MDWIRGPQAWELPRSAGPGRHAAGAPSGFGLHFAGASVDTNIAHAVVACADKLRALGVAVEEPDP